MPSSGWTNFTFQMGSVDHDEGWAVYGSNQPLGTSGYIQLLSGHDQSEHVAASYLYYYFMFSDEFQGSGDHGGQNVLLSFLSLTENSEGFITPISAHSHFLQGFP